MFELLAAAIDELTIPLEGEAVAEACRLLDRLTAKVTLAAGRFAHEGGFRLDGAVNMVGWLRAHTGMTNPQAPVCTGLAAGSSTYPPRAKPGSRGDSPAATSR